MPYFIMYNLFFGFQVEKIKALLFCYNYVIKVWGEWKLTTNFKLISIKNPFVLALYFHYI